MRQQSATLFHGGSIPSDAFVLTSIGVVAETVTSARLKPGRRGFDSCPYHHADVMKQVDIHGSDPCGLGPWRFDSARPHTSLHMGGGSAQGWTPRSHRGHTAGFESRAFHQSHPPVAQRTRALGFGPRMRRFESCRGVFITGRQRASASPTGCNPAASGFGGSTPSLPTR